MPHRPGGGNHQPPASPGGGSRSWIWPTPHRLLGVLVVIEPDSAGEIRTDGAIEVRTAIPADAPEWTAMRAALWPDEPNAAHADLVARFLVAPAVARPGIPEAVLVAVHSGAAAGARLVGFAELSRRAYAE